MIHLLQGSHQAHWKETSVTIKAPVICSFDMNMIKVSCQLHFRDIHYRVYMIHVFVKSITMITGISIHQIHYQNVCSSNPLHLLRVSIRVVVFVLPSSRPSFEVALSLLMYCCTHYFRNFFCWCIFGQLLPSSGFCFSHW